MTTLSIGPGLANFPAFPDPTTVDPTSLGFVITAERFSFSINGYQFEFNGDFSAIPEPRVPNFFATLSPDFPPSALPFITITGNTVTQLATGQTAIGFSGSAATLPANFFFATLLDPRNFTDDIITAFFGDITQFNTLDLSAFNNGAYMGAPNASVISPEGAIGVVSFESELDGFTFTNIIGGGGADRLFGNALANVIQGNEGGDFLFGVDGDDLLTGNQGDDVLVGGLGHDTLRGGAENDTLVGEAGDDELSGGAGNDVLDGGTGRNRLTGGQGADRFVLTDGVSSVLDFSRNEGDKVDVSGLGIRSPRQLARQLNAGLRLNSSGQLVLDLSPQSGVGNSRQKLIFENLTNLNDLQVSDFVVGAHISGSRQSAPIFGTQLADTILGGKGDNQLFGRAGADLLKGQKGNDLLAGGRGADYLLGNRGADVLTGDRGNDWLKGGRGDDLLYGGPGADVIEGGRGNDVLDGGAGRDRLTGNKGNNTLTGGLGADIFHFTQLTGDLDRITDFEVGLDKIDLSDVLRGPVTLQNFDQYIQVTSPGPTELTRFVGIDANGARGGSNFTPLFQIDDVPDTQLLAIGNYVI